MSKIVGRKQLPEGQGVLADSNRQVPALGSPVGVILNPSGSVSVMAGGVFQLSVTACNQGTISALIDIFIDDSSDPLREWCISPYHRLALNPGQSSEIVFQIQVPAEAIPGNYNYAVVVDAPHHYPEDTPIQYRSQLQVVPFVQESQRVTDPTFTLQPATTADTPVLLPPGQPLPVVVLVHNRSDRVDRFRLSCPDLASEWFKISYPEMYTAAGLVRTAEALELNPGDRGEIQLTLMPPLSIWAGIYSPSVRLHSANYPDLVLLDVVYLQLREIYLLDIELLTIAGRVRRQPGLYDLRLLNRGNTVREVVFVTRGVEDGGLCTYTLVSDRVRLLPGDLATVRLQVQPTNKWWRRPWRDRSIGFVVEVEDVQTLPLATDRLSGSLEWQGRPRWQWLLFLLALLGIIGAIAFLIWWLLTRPPIRSQIVDFSPSATFYQEANGDAIRLNWQISHPEKIRSLKLQGLSPDGVVLSNPIVYDFGAGVPNELKSFCSLDRVLTCQNVLTDARQAGSYIFELALIPNNQRQAVLESRKTTPIQIAPIPLPQIVEFTSTQPTYEEIDNTVPNPSIFTNSILLNWQINSPKQIKEIRLIGRSTDGSVTSPLKTYDFTQGIPLLLTRFCFLKETELLICRGVPASDRKVGSYIFEMSVVPQQGNQLESKKTEQIKVNRRIIPTRINEFKVNDAEALPKYIIRINENKFTTIKLSWKVEGGRNIKVELLPSPGTVNRQGTIIYPLSQKPTIETITLQVTNEAGEQIKRSVNFETIAPLPTPTTLPSLPPPPAASPPKERLPVITVPPTPSSPRSVRTTPSPPQPPAKTPSAPQPTSSPKPARVTPIPASPLPQANRTLPPTRPPRTNQVPQVVFPPIPVVPPPAPTPSSARVPQPASPAAPTQVLPVPNAPATPEITSQPLPPTNPRLPTAVAPQTNQIPQVILPPAPVEFPAIPTPNTARSSQPVSPLTPAEVPPAQTPSSVPPSPSALPSVPSKSNVTEPAELPPELQ